MKMLCSVQLSKHRYKTPEGYLVCKDCIIARTGKQTYLKSELYGVTEGEDGYIDVDRKASQVFDEKTMASFEGKPLTIEHPDVSVSPENYKDLSVGHVHNVRRGTFEGQEVMFADINVYDAEAIDLIESGEMEELSCGYDCDITDGPHPEQINIRGNHVALCEQGRAGIARIQDSWGAKPIIKDSVSRGTLIQEFGRYGEQYKIIKIDGNVLYCEELVTHKNTLFKKDKENVDWAVINKGQVNDSLHKKEEPIGIYVNEKYIESREKAWKLAKKLYKENKLGSFYEYWIDEFGYPHNSDLIGTLKRSLKDSVSTDRKLLYSKEPHYTIELEEATLYYSIDGTGRFSGYRDTEYDDKIWDNFEEAKAAAIKLFNEYKDKKEIKDNSYSYYSVKIVKWVEGGGDFVDLNDNNNGPFPALTAIDEKEIPESLKKSLNIGDAKEEKHIPNPYSTEFTNKELDEFIRKQYEDKSTDALGKPKGKIRKKKIFIDKKERDEFVKSLPKEAEPMMDEFDHTWTDKDGEPERWLVYWEVYYWEDVKTNDSFVNLFVIALSDDNWLDENDRPTSDKNKAKKFKTKEDAESYRKIYCKGVVEPMVASVKDSWEPKGEIEKVKELLQGIEYEKISHDDEIKVIDIYFKDKKELRKAGRKLVGLYDIELFEDPDELSITLYDKFKEPREIYLTEDSEIWFGCNIRKGKPAEDFKQYLKDRGLYFEPSENGDFIHFEVRNADEDVKKEIKAINEHYRKVGLSDEYSKKFYSKAIKSLKEKLEKLERNELLDTNQQDYQIQKNNMMKEIKKQIEEYSEKLNEF